MSEQVLLEIYKDAYSPYLQQLAQGDKENQDKRRQQIEFFCNRPLAVVLATLTPTDNMTGAETVARAQHNRDQLRTEFGKSRKKGNRIVHR